MTKLEVRILCRILPKSMNELDQLIPSDRPAFSRSHASSIDNHQSLHEIIKQHQKSIRNHKRQMLAKNLEDYESAIEQNEFLYQEALFNLESEVSDGTIDQGDTLMSCLYNYLHCRTMTKMREIRFNETIVRQKLLHPCHRRSPVTKNNNTISIYPEAIIEIFENVFTKDELDLLSSLGNAVLFLILLTCSVSISSVIGGPSYIRLNQSSIKDKKQVQKKIQHQHTTIMDKLASDLHRHHGLPTKSTILKKFSEQLETMLNQQFSTPLSYHDIHRTRWDLKKVHSIKRKLKKLPVIIRESDKSGILHIGYKSDYDRKVLLYQEKTNAYVELPSNPLTDTFYKVVRLLNDLNTKKQVRVWQQKKMMPDQKKIELAYLYFLPKPHKVSVE